MSDETADWRSRLQDEVDHLRQTRDELRLQLHLAAADVRDTWSSVEASWHKLEGRVKKVRGAAQDAGEDVEEATKLLIDEVKQGYETIKRAL